MITRISSFILKLLSCGLTVRQPTHLTVPSVILSKPVPRDRIDPGDLVSRKYPINITGYTQVGLVLERDNNGFLAIAWGDKVEHMWDDYDLMRLE